LEILCTWSAVVIILAVLNIVAIKAKNKSLI
jgi:hypothetical protein